MNHAFTYSLASDLNSLCALQPYILILAISTRDPRINKIFLQNSLLVIPIINTVVTSRWSNMRAVDIWAKWYHVLMNFPAEKGITTELIALSESDRLSKVFITCRLICILLVGSVAILFMCRADSLRQDVRDILDSLISRSCVDFCGSLFQEKVQKELEPPEYSIVLRNFAVFVEFNPCIYGHGY